MANPKIHIREGSVLTKSQALSSDLVDDNGNTVTLSQVGSTGTYKDNTSGLYFDTPDHNVTIKKVGNN
jgi:hypothetical protein